MVEREKEGKHLYRAAEVTKQEHSRRLIGFALHKLTG
jgi:hypothetical protein